MQRPYLDPQVAASSAAADEFMKVMANMPKPQIIGIGGEMFAIEPLPSGAIGGIVYTPPKALGLSAGASKSAVTGADYSEFGSPELILTLPDPFSGWWDSLVVTETLDDIADAYGGAYAYVNIPPPDTGAAQSVTMDYHKVYQNPWRSEDGLSRSNYKTDTTASLEGYRSGGATSIVATADFYTFSDYSSNGPKDQYYSWDKMTGQNALTVTQTPITFGYSSGCVSGDLQTTLLQQATFTHTDTQTWGSNPSSGVSDPSQTTDFTVTFAQIGGPAPDFATLSGMVFDTVLDQYPSAGGVAGDLASLFAPKGDVYEKG